jgi:hypothetical protein
VLWLLCYGTKEGRELSVLGCPKPCKPRCCSAAIGLLLLPSSLKQALANIDPQSATARAEQVAAAGASRVFDYASGSPSLSANISTLDR